MLFQMALRIDDSTLAGTQIDFLLFNFPEYKKLGSFNMQRLREMIILIAKVHNVKQKFILASK